MWGTIAGIAAPMIGNWLGSGAGQPQMSGAATGAEKEYMRMLQRRSKEGMFSKSDRAGMLQNQAMSTGNQVGMAKQGITNQMTSQGLEGSIIGGQAGMGADMARMAQLGQANRGYQAANKKYMLQSQDQLMGTKMDLAQRQRESDFQKKQNKYNMFAGVGGGIEKRAVVMAWGLMVADSRKARRSSKVIGPHPTERAMAVD